MTIRRCSAAVTLGVGLAALAGCAREGAVPDPEPAVERYAEALQAGDAEALYALMSDESRQTISRAELRRILKDQRRELAAHAGALRAPGREIAARAEVRYDDGEVVTLDLVDGAFRVTAADALPAAARTPAQALGQLRRVLARRSYAGLLRVLSPRTRGAVEGDLRSLVEGLSAPEALPIEVVGDTATVEVPGGHRVELRREEGVWVVDDFD
ncbi:MAG: hypothetical protein JRI23_00440 [Deltaproteobacteria bacterium]|jgi:hypothetical protein|nr:hypothetical protein [Deltaproteobacteria bacterium]MBW2529913.1 hypothetical protein [Deltaproteobacteria bacterium]